MKDQEQPTPLQQAIDSAALAGAATAAAVAVFVVPGPFVPLNAALGLTLLAIVLTYEMKRFRYRWQNLAFGCVCGLCALLVLGFVSEFLYSGFDLRYWEKLENPPRSNVNQWFLFFGWASLAVVFTRLGLRFAVRVARPDETEGKGGERRGMNNRTKFAAILVISGAVCVLFALATSAYGKYDSPLAWTTAYYGISITALGILRAFIGSRKSKDPPGGRKNIGTTPPSDDTSPLQPDKRD